MVGPLFPPDAINGIQGPALVGVEGAEPHDFHLITPG